MSTAYTTVVELSDLATRQPALRLEPCSDQSTAVLTNCTDIGGLDGQQRRVENNDTRPQSHASQQSYTTDALRRAADVNNIDTASNPTYTRDSEDDVRSIKKRRCRFSKFLSNSGFWQSMLGSLTVMSGLVYFYLQWCFLGWTAQKDYIMYCQSLQDGHRPLSSDCERAVNTSLPVPPLSNKFNYRREFVEHMPFYPVSEFDSDFAIRKIYLPAAIAFVIQGCLTVFAIWIMTFNTSYIRKPFRPSLYTFPIKLDDEERLINGVCMCAKTTSSAYPRAGLNISRLRPGYRSSPEEKEKSYKATVLPIEVEETENTDAMASNFQTKAKLNGNGVETRNKPPTIILTQSSDKPPTGLRQRHRALEQRPQLFRCTFKTCNSEFLTDSKLQRHVEAHTRLPPMGCFEDGCDRNGKRGFQSEESLLAHKRVKHPHSL